MNKYEHLISKGVEQPLEMVQAHHAAPFTRYVMLEKDAVRGEGVKIVAHVITDLPHVIPPYCDLHSHDCDEINFITSDSSLRYRIQLEDEVYEVESPCTIYIPSGIRHRAEVLSGRGVYVAIIFTDNYRAFQSNGSQ